MFDSQSTIREKLRFGVRKHLSGEMLYDDIEFIIDDQVIEEFPAILEELEVGFGVP